MGWGPVHRETEPCARGVGRTKTLYRDPLLTDRHTYTTENITFCHSVKNEKGGAASVFQQLKYWKSI